MATTIEKFVFESTENGVQQDFSMDKDSRVVFVKINGAGHPAFYAMVDGSAPAVLRRFAAFHSRVELPPNWIYLGTACNGYATFHVGELISTN